MHSFDLVSKESFIVACDIAHVPLADKSLDIAIYCLALMGTNWSEFIVESNRCLKKNGQLWVFSRYFSNSRLPKCEAASRVKKLGARKALSRQLKRSAFI